MDFSIRNVTIKDLDRVSEMEYICFSLAESGSKLDFFNRITSYPESFFVAEIEGKLVGYIHGASSASNIFNDDLYSDVSYHRKDNEFQLVLGFGVVPEYRKYHIGKKLMATMIDFSKNNNKKSISLTCKKELINYYQAFGFENIGLSNSNLGAATWYDMLLKI